GRDLHGYTFTYPHLAANVECARSEPSVIAAFFQALEPVLDLRLLVAVWLSRRRRGLLRLTCRQLRGWCFCLPCWFLRCFLHPRLLFRPRGLRRSLGSSLQFPLLARPA